MSNKSPHRTLTLQVGPPARSHACQSILLAYVDKETERYAGMTLFDCHETQAGTTSQILDTFCWRITRLRKPSGPSSQRPETFVTHFLFTTVATSPRIRIPEVLRNHRDHRLIMPISIHDLALQKCTLFFVVSCSLEQIYASSKLIFSPTNLRTVVIMIFFEHIVSVKRQEVEYRRNHCIIDSDHQL